MANRAIGKAALRSECASGFMEFCEISAKFRAAPIAICKGCANACKELMNRMNESNESVLVVGAGRIGSRVVRMLRAQGVDVVATTAQTTTRRCLEHVGARVISWHWTAGASWQALIDARCSQWLVTVPPRGGMEAAQAFHEGLHKAAKAGDVRRVIWTSSTAVYPEIGGRFDETDAVHRLSKHSKADMLALEEVHRAPALELGTRPAFTALRLGGLFDQEAHPWRAVVRQGQIHQAGGTVQWVHMEDAARACVFALRNTDALQDVTWNVVCPVASTRGELWQGPGAEADLPRTGGGEPREVLSTRLQSAGFEFEVRSAAEWVSNHSFPHERVTWEGPCGLNHASVVRPPRWWVMGDEAVCGRLLMIHGYKGFRTWGNWEGVAESLAACGWEVIRMDFSHNGHVPPYDDLCVDAEAWSQNRLHMEAEEVTAALERMHHDGKPVGVLGHSRGGAAAVLGAREAERRGVAVRAAVLWAPVSDHFARFPQGEALATWRATDRLEVRNARTGQVLVHPYAFCTEAFDRSADLDILGAARQLGCPVTVVHGDRDEAVHHAEGRAVAKAAPNGVFRLVSGGDHVFGMRHPWPRESAWPNPLRQAVSCTRQALQAP